MRGNGDKDASRQDGLDASLSGAGRSDALRWFFQSVGNRYS